jgi:hypothetical protein
LRILIVSEGKNERGEADLPGALEILVRRLLTIQEKIEFTFDRVSNPNIRAHHGPGKGYFKRAIRWLLEAQVRGFDGLVLVIDEDRDMERRQQLKSAQEWMGAGQRLPRAMGVAVVTFDAWMLADEKALSTVLEIEVQRQKAPEANPDPKRTCAALLVQTSREISQTVMYAEVAGTLNLDLLKERCPEGFGVFAARVESLLAP